MSRFLIVLICLMSMNVYSEDNWQQQVKQWQVKRDQSLRKPFGWVSLVGMEWFHNGDNNIGSGADNNIILSHGPINIGSFNLNGSNMNFTPEKGVKIKADDVLIQNTIPVKMDTSGSPTVFTVDSFQFYVIERGKPALRIKDSKADTLLNFSGVEYFPVTEKYYLDAEFIPYKPEKDIEIINVLGLLTKEKSPGKLKFNLDGTDYELDTLDAGDSYYLIFADRTSGRTTYGPGRFLYVDKPAAGQSLTKINFNRAYNPPCAFTDYSTCPLPPPQNRLRAFIEAGEKKYIQQK